MHQRQGQLPVVVDEDPNGALINFRLLIDTSNTPSMYHIVGRLKDEFPENTWHVPTSFSPDVYAE
jgi:hypothetical protein